MGLFDKAKKLAEEHASQVESAIDKVAGVVDSKTGGKYSDKIDKGVAAAKGFVGDDPAPAPPPPPAAAAADPVEAAADPVEGGGSGPAPTPAP